MNNSSSDEDANGNTGSSSSKKKSNMERIPLFGLWQTTLYKPPPVVNGKIPRNSYGNWELWTRGHTPAGSVHLAHDKIAFLIHQDPKKQVYLSLTKLIEYFLFGKPLQESLSLPIDIINSENYPQYLK